MVNVDAFPGFCVLKGAARILAKFFAFLMLACLFLLPASPSGAQAVGPAAGDRAAIAATIRDQLAAFARDDGQAAFALASPTIRQLFGSVDNFMAMVRTGYPAVHRARNVEFRDAIGEGDEIVQRVRLVGPDGRPVVAAYQMQKQPDGTWKINGCSILEDDDRSV